MERRRAKSWAKSLHSISDGAEWAAKAPALLGRVAGLSWSLQKSICNTQENGARKEHGADPWIAPAGCADCYVYEQRTLVVQNH